MVYSTWWCTATLCLVLCCLCSVWYLVIHSYPMFSAVRCLVPWWYTATPCLVLCCLCGVWYLVVHGYRLLSCLLALPYPTYRSLNAIFAQAGEDDIRKDCLKYGVWPFVTVSQFVATFCCQKQWTIFCSHTPSK